MSQHILIKKAFTYPIKDNTPDMMGCSYDSEKGYWISQFNTPIIFDSSIEKPSTKKADRETGEDQKGE
jgi:hypothetical protein